MIDQPYLSFYNHRTQQLQPDIWTELRQGLWRTFDIDQHLANEKQGFTQLHLWKPVLKDFTIVYPGFRWDAATQGLVEERFYPRLLEEASFDTVVKAAAEVFARYEGRRIGVHLSGGLDSSLVIALLRHLHIPFVPIGLASRRWEFRTERHIQELLATWGEDALLLEMDDFPFYTDLDRIPTGQIPDGGIKMNHTAAAMAEAFAERGVDIVFSGQGGDTLLVDAVPQEGAIEGFNIGNEFNFEWDAAVHYAPRGIELTSFFAEPTIIEQLTSLRRGQREDATKRWARQFFARILPRELAEWDYVADFFGTSMSGLELAKPLASRIIAEANALLPHPIFSPEGVEEFLETNVFAFDYHAYIAFCSKLSIATWLCGLKREGIIV